MSDPTAAERARRYRARQRETVAAVAGGTVVELLRELIGEVRGLRVAVDNSGIRDERRPDRDATPRHGSSNDAPAYARSETPAAAPTGRLGGGSRRESRDAVTAFDAAAIQTRILAAVEVRSASGGVVAHTVAAIADSIDVDQRAVVEGLIALRGLGVVERVAAPDVTQRDRWQVVTRHPPMPLQIGLDERAQGFEEVPPS